MQLSRCSWTGHGKQSGTRNAFMLGTWGRRSNCSVKSKHNQELPGDMLEGMLPLWKTPLQWVLMAQVWNFAFFCGNTKPVNGWGWWMAEWVQYSSWDSAQLIFGAACLEGSLLCQAAASPEVDESRQLYRPVSDSGVCKMVLLSWCLCLSPSYAPWCSSHSNLTSRTSVLPWRLWRPPWMSACFYCVFWLLLLVTLPFHILLLCGFVFNILMLLSVSIFLLSLSFISSLMKNILYTWLSW